MLIITAQSAGFGPLRVCVCCDSAAQFGPRFPARFALESEHPGSEHVENVLNTFHQSISERRNIRGRRAHSL